MGPLTLQIMRYFLTILAIAAPLPALAIDLILPVDCVLGDTCYIQQFVDHDKSEDASDFRCGPQTYDTHKGTDFALPSQADLSLGFDVLAAADGIIYAIRDSMPDAIQGVEGAPDVTGKECGNGLVIRHSEGWETQYCHMAKGSILVEVGQSVSAGDSLGHIGLSGKTQFPHLHFSVRKDGEVIDPFSPIGQSCSNDSATLWSDELPTPAGGVVSAGFAPGIPEYLAVKAGTAAAESLAPDQNIVFWGFAFGGRQDDILRITILGPDGPFHTNEFKIERDKAQFMRASGRRAPVEGWPKGLYQGQASLIRDGNLIGTQTGEINVQ